MLGDVSGRSKMVPRSHCSTIVIRSVNCTMFEHSAMLRSLRQMSRNGDFAEVLDPSHTFCARELEMQEKPILWNVSTLHLS